MSIIMFEKNKLVTESFTAVIKTDKSNPEIIHFSSASNLIEIKYQFSQPTVDLAKLSMRKGYLSMGLGPNWYQIRNKTCCIPELANFMQKKYILKTLKRSSLAYQCVSYRPENNTKGGPPKYCILKFLKCKNEINKRIELKNQMKKQGHLSSHHVCSQRYGH